MKFFFVLISLFYIANGFTQEIGKITILRGQVSKSNARMGVNKKPVSKGDSVNVGDVLNCANDGYVAIKMNDGALFNIGNNSSLGFEGYKSNTDNEKNSVYNLINGRIRSLFKPTQEGHSQEMKTPLGTVKLKNGEYAADVYKDKGRLKTDVAVIEGSVEIQDKTGTKTFLEKGEIYESLQTKSGKIMAKTSTIADEVFERLSKGVDGGIEFLFDSMVESRSAALQEGSGINFEGGDLPKKNKSYLYAIAVAIILLIGIFYKS